jgi:signal transduction histidine kinase
MRQAITRVALITAVLAVIVFGVPLAYVMNRLLLGEEQTELERLALRAAVSVPSVVSPGPDGFALPKAEPAVRIGVYDATGRLVGGRGPVRADADVRRALTGVVSDHGSNSDLVVAVPASENKRVVAVVRASSPRAAIAARSRGIWAGMVGLALLAFGAAAGLAVVQARRLARPIERLEGVAEELGGGNFSARSLPSGILEIDRASSALNKTAERLGDLVSRERAFAANASHQLRTPLTGLRLTLETGLNTPGADLELAARSAIRSVDEMSRTVDDVLSVTRSSTEASKPLDVNAVLADVERRWQGLLSADGRSLQVRLLQPPPARASEAAVRQIVDVLIDNAYRHGAGAVVITAREASAAAAIDVQDQGSTTGVELLTDGPLPVQWSTDPHLGLTLARRLAEGEGGRLVHARTEPRTRLTLLLPAADTNEEP